MPDVTMTGPIVILKLHESVLKEVELKEQLTIGRKAGNDLVIEDQAVSGRHARIVKIHSVYFLEDLNSTNGTHVNGRKIDRKQLKDTDVITIGTHRLVFRDEVRNDSVPVRPLAADSDQTMIVTGAIQSGRAGTCRQSPVVRIVSGRTDRSEYPLTKQLSIIGTQDDAAIKLTGWFAPKTAAMIGRREDGCFIATAEGGKIIKVNGQVVTGQVDLKNGDLIEVAGVKMSFYLDTPAKP